jgi:hypothetical protein
MRIAVIAAHFILGHPREFGHIALGKTPEVAVCV